MSGLTFLVLHYLGDKTALFSVRPGNLWVTGTLKGVTEEFFGTHLVAES